MITLNQLATDVHETAKSKGWWEKPKSEKEVLKLIASEISEATEEVRNNKPALYFVHIDQSTREVTNLAHFPGGHKPEGEAVELADAFIRCMDYCGFLNIQPTSLFPHPIDVEDIGVNGILTLLGDAPDYDYFRNYSPLDAHYDIEETVYLAVPLEIKFLHLMSRIARYFKHKNWDLEKVIELKCKFNGTRSYRHGNKSY